MKFIVAILIIVLLNVPLKAMLSPKNRVIAQEAIDLKLWLMAGSLVTEESINNLLDEGACTDRDDFRTSALHRAVISGNPSTIQILLKRGAFIDREYWISCGNLLGRSDQRAFFDALEKNRLDIVRMLIRAGARINFFDENFAADEKLFQVFGSLPHILALMRGEDIPIIDITYQTFVDLVVYSAARRRPDLLARLMQSVHAANLQDEDLVEAFCSAARAGSALSFKILMAHRAKYTKVKDIHKYLVPLKGTVLYSAHRYWPHDVRRHNYKAVIKLIHALENDAQQDALFKCPINDLTVIHALLENNLSVDEGHFLVNCGTQPNSIIKKIPLAGVLIQEIGEIAHAINNVGIRESLKSFILRNNSQKLSLPSSLIVFAASGAQ